MLGPRHTRQLAGCITLLAAAVLVPVALQLTARHALAEEHGAPPVLFMSSCRCSVADDGSVTIDIEARTDLPINAVAATLRYPSDRLQVIQVSSDDSIIPLWIVKPYVSQDGLIAFAGIIPTPGYRGMAGRLFTVKMQKKGRGAAEVDFRDAELLANDGESTNVTGESEPLILDDIESTPAALCDADSDVANLSALLVQWAEEPDRCDQNRDGSLDLTDLSIYFSKSARVGSGVGVQGALRGP